jgi:hypothetical protein
MKPNIILSGLIIFLLVSCSVKEQREACPCILSIRISDTLSAVGNLALCVWDENPIFFDKMAMSECTGIYERSVPKGLYTVSAVVGENKMTRDDKTLAIPLGYDCDKIWGYTSKVDCHKEFAIDTAKFHKQFSLVNIEFANLIHDFEGLEFYVKSGTAGLDLTDLRPAEGEFSYLLNLDKNHCGTVCLPRQKQGSRSLVVEILKGGVIIETLPLWSWIEEVGYDWFSPNLNDINISIDYSISWVTIKVEGWKDSEKKIFII